MGRIIGLALMRLAAESFMVAGVIALAVASWWSRRRRMLAAAEYD